MKKLITTSLLVFALAWQANAQTLNQNANWPNTNWTITGNYDSYQLYSNPTVDQHFHFTLSCNSCYSTIAAESPVIDLSAAFNNGEKYITVSLDYNYDEDVNNDILELQYFDAANSIWVAWNSIPQALPIFYSNFCASTATITTGILDIYGFNATQLTGFKYRIFYEGTGNYSKFCISSPSISSALSPTCYVPTGLSVSNIAINSADLNWTDPHNASNGYIWTVYNAGDVPGTDTPVATGTAPSGATSITMPGLPGSSSFDAYLQSDCGAINGLSNLVGSVQFTTLFPTCGGVFVDLGGLFGNYSNNQNWATTIVPANTGDAVTVNFSVFDVEPSGDALYVYDGPDTSSPLISSGNPATSSGFPAGGYYGTTIPGPFTSTHLSGALTFVFMSNGSNNNAGWYSLISCAPSTICFPPTGLTANPHPTSVDLSWTPGPNAANGYKCYVYNSGDIPGTDLPVATLNTSATNATITGLITGNPYDAYVKSDCGSTLGLSNLAGPVGFSDITCGDNFYDPGGQNGDYAKNLNWTKTILPVDPGYIVTVTFTDFDIEPDRDLPFGPGYYGDALYVYDGPDTNSPLISSGNPYISVSGFPAGAYYGFNNPGPFTSTHPSGALTFVFRSNDWDFNFSGWEAYISCSIPSPSGLTFSNLTHNSVDLSWTENGTATEWEIEYGLTGFVQGSGTIISDADGTPSEHLAGLSPSTLYDFYVRAIATPTIFSDWAGPEFFDTKEINDNLANAIPLNMDATCSGNIYTNNHATSQAGEPTGSCFVDQTAGTPDRSVWFSFISPPSGKVVISTAGFLDTEIAVYPAPTNVNDLSTLPPEIGCDQDIGSINSNALLSLNGLNQGITYYIQVDVYDNFGGNFCIEVHDNGCPEPTNLTANNVTHDSADLSWTENGTALEWEIEYGPAGFIPGTGTVVVDNDGALGEVLSNLAPNTAHSFYVTAICGPGYESDQIGPISFTTLAQPPANDDLANAILLTVDATCSGDAFNNINATAQAGEPVGSCFGPNTPVDNSVWFAFVAPASESVIITTDLPPGNIADTEIAVYATPSNINDPSTLPAEEGCGQNGGSVVGAGYMSILTLFNLTPGNTYYIQVDGYNGAVGTFCIEVQGHCASPSNLSVSNIGSSTADLAWAENGTALEWEIEYGLAGFAPGSGTVIPDNDGILGETISGLSQNTSYEFYVTAICGPGVGSMQIGPSGFTTLFNPLTNDALANATLLTVDATCSGDAFNNINATAQAGEPVGGCFTSVDNSVWFAFVAPASGSVIITTDLPPGNIADTEIAVYATPSNINDPSTLPAEEGCGQDEGSVVGAGYMSILTLFNLTPGNTYYIQVDGYNGAVGTFCIEVQGHCASPSNLSVSNIGSSTADLAWAENGTASLWDIELVTAGTTPTGVPTATGVSNPYMALGLSSGTQYEFYVRAACAVGSFSSWTGPFAFATDCVPVTIPFCENFSSTTNGSIPQCWNFINLSNGVGQVQGQFGYSFAMFNLYPTPADYIFVSPEITNIASGYNQVSFDMTGSTGYELIVGTMANPLDANTFTAITTFYLTGSPESQVVNVPAGTDLHLAFKHVQATGTVFLDNICFAVSCPVPTALTATNITSTAADLGWTENGTATEWEIEYGPAGFPPGSGNMVSDNDGVLGETISGLSQNTSYEFYVVAVCGPSDVSSQIGPIGFTTAVCQAPLNLSVSNITQTTADLSWNAVPGANNGYTWYVFNSNDDPLTATPVANGNTVLGTTLDTATGLLPNTGYDFYVQSNCATNSSSNLAGPILFDTPCGAIATFSENFDTNANFPDCWSKIQPAGTTINIQAFAGFSFPNKLNLGNNVVDNVDLYAITPQLLYLPVGGYRLRFQARKHPVSTLEIGVMTDPTNPATYTPVQIIPANLTYQEFTVPFNTTVPGSYLVFKGLFTNVNNEFINIDDVVWEPIPTCLPPTGLQVSNLAQTSVDISWNTVAGANSGYEWSVYFTGDVPGANTPLVSGSTSAGTTTATVAGLTANTDYDLYVLADCGSTDGQSTLTGPVSFTTFCGPSGPFFENFDTFSSVLPDCWDKIKPFGTDVYVVSNQVGISNNGYDNTDLFLITPQLSNLSNGTHRLRFESYSLYAGLGVFVFEVGTMSNPNNPSTFSSKQTINLTNSYQEYVVNFNTITSDSYIAFKVAYSSGANIDLFIDDVYWETIPEFIYQNSAWTPSDPSGATTSTDDILVINGTASLTADTQMNNLTINPGATLEIEGILSPSGEIVNNGSLVFVNDDPKLGQLDDMTGSTISGTGEVTVQRQIPARDADIVSGDINGAYRYITSAVNSTESIHANWQEGATGINDNPNPGYGIFITGSSTGVNGFDQTAAGAPSMFGWDGNAQNYLAVPNTDVDNLVAGVPYVTYIWGDRGVDIISSNDPQATNTTLRATGNLVVGDKTFNGLSPVSNTFNLVGNPYQAIVDMNDVLANSTNLNTAFYYVWDPNLGTRGAYALVILNTGTTTPSTSEANQYLMPGQAAFVLTANNQATSILFEEGDKDVTQTPTDVFRPQNVASIELQLLQEQAFNNGGPLSDALRVNFSAGESNAVMPNDAPKLWNFDETTALVNGNSYLAVENRALPIDGETLQLHNDQYRVSDYVFKALIENLPGNITAYLKDAYLNTQNPLNNNGPTLVNFSVDESVPASIAPDRFSIVFAVNGLSTDAFAGENFTIYPNPVKGGNFFVLAPGLAGEEVQVSLYDLLGREVCKSLKTIGADNRAEIKTGNLQAGVYMVKMENKGRGFFQKLIVR